MNSNLPDNPLRILHIASGDLWAGAEVQLFTLLTQLHRRPDVQVHAVLLNDGELALRLREQSIPVTIYDESRLSGTAILVRLCRLMNSIRPHIVHTHRQKENVLGSFANLLTVRTPCVRTSHGAPEHKHSGWRSLHKRLFAAFDILCGKRFQQRIVAVSTDLADTLRQTFASEKIIVIENGVDLETLKTVTTHADFRANEPNAIHIGIVGRLVQIKRVDLFLEMAAVLVKTAPEKHWRFHVIGDGNLRTQLQQQSERSGLADKVRFHGHRGDSATCLASLDALVMCSDHEGMPMTPLEAIALGTPVVAHDVGGLTDILGNGAGGALVRDHTASGYAAALLNLLTQNKTPLITLARQHIEARFSAASNASRMLDLYHQLLT